MAIAISMDEYYKQQVEFKKKKIHEQAEKIDAIYMNEFYSMLHENEADDELGGREERTYRSMLNQYISQESTKKGKGFFTKNIEECLLKMQFGQQASL